MGTTPEVLSAWFDRGLEASASHMIVVCDEYDWEDYPVYVAPQEDAREITQEYRDKSMQKVMEVYNLSMPKAEQMAEHRAFHYDSPSTTNEALMSDTPNTPIPNSAGGDVDFTPDAVRGYFDMAIRAWRQTRDTSTDEVEQAMAVHYIDAFQSARMSLFGDLLQTEEPVE